MSKVKVGQNIYRVYRGSISKEPVFMKNDTCFCFESMFSSMYVDEVRIPLNYDEEGEKWFRTFKEAKEFLLKDNPDCRVKKFEENYWELVEK